MTTSKSLICPPLFRSQDHHKQEYAERDEDQPVAVSVRRTSSQYYVERSERDRQRRHCAHCLLDALGCPVLVCCHGRRKGKFYAEGRVPILAPLG